MRKQSVSTCRHVLLTLLASCAIACSGERRMTSCAAAAATSPVTQPAAAAIVWEPWSDGIFARARAEQKFVLLDLEAVWCHWCHVQDEVTYRDPKVIELLNARYIAVKVDQDARPDISNRYEDYGWPATIVFNADGGEIAKRRGYLPPRAMSSMLQAVIDDPTPGPSVQAEPVVTFANLTALPEESKKKLGAKLVEGYDAEFGGWGKIHKYVDWDKIELEILRARAGDPAAEQRARQTLTAGLKLIDPVWGGVYQYSIEGDWDHPHFEKLMQFQGQIMRIYALAYAAFGDAAYLKAAGDIHRYIGTFLRSDAKAYLVSQDADLVEGTYADAYFALDDAGRRKLGVPRVDRHVYARENGWAIEGLTGLYAWGGDVSALDDARAAAEWVIAHRSVGDGGFSHDEHDIAGPYFGDTLAMGRAFLDLYSATADRVWLKRAIDAAGFMGARFGPPDSVGFLTIAPSSALGYAPGPDVDENVAAARFFNLLSHDSGMKEHRALAERAMRLLAAPQIVESHRSSVAGILLADGELSAPPLHLTVVGPKASAAAQSLFLAAEHAPIPYRRLEWWDPSEGPLPNPDVDYPQLKVPAAFLCAGNACSSPIKDPVLLAGKLKARLPR